MARIRTIKPEFFRSRALTECSLSARVTFIGLWTACDDEGRYRYEPELLKADIWPFEPHHDIGGDVQALAEHGMVCIYESAGKRYLHVVNWHEHQKINRPSPSRLPECSRSPHGGFPEHSSPRARAQEVELGTRNLELEREQGVPETASPSRVVAIRPEIDRLCDLLADGVQVTTGERPKAGKRWHDACRRLLDVDGYTAEQVEALICWSQADEFWRSNILSMPKLREKRLTLIAQARRDTTRRHDEPASWAALREL
jgi:hypothetical protein